LLELGKPAEAAEAFGKVLAISPDDPAAPRIALARARALEEAGRVEPALTAYDHVARARPQTEEDAKGNENAELVLTARLARARLLSIAGRHAEAASAFEAIAGQPGDGVEANLKSIGESLAAVLADWGWSLIDAGRVSDADRVFERLLKEFPESPLAADARFNLAESANAAGDRARVVSLLIPLVSVRAEGETAVPATARESNEEASGPALVGGPQIEPATGDAAVAETGADEKDEENRGPGLAAAETEPKPQAETPKPAAVPARLLPAVLYRLGRTQIELRDWKAAATTLDRLIAVEPNGTYGRDAKLLRAEASLNLGDATAALATIDSIQAEPPPTTGATEENVAGESAGVARRLRVQCLLALKRWEDALKDAEAIEAGLPPDDAARPELDYARGRALQGLARMEEARTAYQAVIDARGPRDDLSAQAHLMRGETFFHEENFSEARREFLMVDVLYTDAPRWQAMALLEAGKVYERLDQWADAAEVYDRLCSKFPDDPNVKEARDRRDGARRRSGAASTTSNEPGEREEKSSDASEEPPPAAGELSPAAPAGTVEPTPSPGSGVD
jgi:TolA-binding protein